jgi:short-subunit dehydrogenase
MLRAWATARCSARWAAARTPVVRDGLRALASNQAVRISGAANLAMAESIRLTPRVLARRLVGALQRSRG